MSFNDDAKSLARKQVEDQKQQLLHERQAQKDSVRYRMASWFDTVGMHPHPELQNLSIKGFKGFSHALTWAKSTPIGVMTDTIIFWGNLTVVRDRSTSVFKFLVNS